MTTVDGKAFIVDACDDPMRYAVYLPLAQMRAEVAAGAHADAVLTMGDVDGYLCAGDVPGREVLSVGSFLMVECLGPNLRHLNTCES